MVETMKQKEVEEIIIRHDEKLSNIHKELKNGEGRFGRMESDIKCLVRFKDKSIGTVIAISFMVSVVTIVVSLIINQ